MLQAYHSLHPGRGSAYNVGIVVEHGVLDHGGKDEQEADSDEQVHGGHVGHPGEGVSGHGTQGGHGQHCGDTWKGRRCQRGSVQIETLLDVADSGRCGQMFMNHNVTP